MGDILFSLHKSFGWKKISWTVWMTHHGEVLWFQPKGIISWGRALAGSNYSLNYQIMRSVPIQQEFNTDVPGAVSLKHGGSLVSGLPMPCLLRLPSGLTVHGCSCHCYLCWLVQAECWGCMASGLVGGGCSICWVSFSHLLDLQYHRMTGTNLIHTYCIRQC